MEAYLKKISPIIQELQQDFEAIAMPRSGYVLENLVVKVHEHPTEQWRQCVIELKSKYFNIRRALIRQQIIERDIEAESDELEIELKRIDLEELGFSLIGYIREFEALYQIYKQFPRFSRDELDAGQAEYWYNRLTKQAQQDVQAHGRVSVGNLEGLRQIGIKVNGKLNSGEVHEQKSPG